MRQKTGNKLSNNLHIWVFTIYDPPKSSNAVGPVLGCFVLGLLSSHHLSQSHYNPYIINHIIIFIIIIYIESCAVSIYTYIKMFTLLIEKHNPSVVGNPPLTHHPFSSQPLSSSVAAPWRRQGHSVSREDAAELLRGRGSCGYCILW